MLPKLLIFASMVGLVLCQKLDQPNCTIPSCTECYNYLVHNVLKSDQNQYNMTKTFFPPANASPVSVIVYYNYRDDNGDIDESIPARVWFWTASTFYHTQPISVLQYLSLFFTDPSLRVSYLNITLDAECSNVSSSYMQLLTQRLKLYTSTFEIQPVIKEDDSKPTADSAETIFMWNNNHKKVGRFLISYPLVLCLVSLSMSLFAITYYLFAKPHDYYHRAKELITLKSTKGREARTQIYVIMTVSLVFSVYTMCMSSVALNYQSKIHEEFKLWYRDENLSSVQYHLSTTYMILDAITFIVCFFLFIFYCVYLCLNNCFRDDKNESKFYSFVNAALPHYFLAAPIVNVFSHIDLIIIGFIQNPYHATGVAVSYGIILFTCVALLQMLSHIFSPHDCCQKSSDSSCCEKNETIYCVWIFIVITILVLLLFVFLIALYFLIPINIAFDEAPNRLVTIYQSVVVILAAFLAYWILLRFYRSPFDVFINVKTNCENWNKKSDATKEKEIAEMLFRIMRHQAKIAMLADEQKDEFKGGESELEDVNGDVEVVRHKEKKGVRKVKDKDDETPVDIEHQSDS